MNVKSVGPIPGETVHTDDGGMYRRLASDNWERITETGEAEAVYLDYEVSALEAAYQSFKKK